jgi:hypothetical protein
MKLILKYCNPSVSGNSDVKLETLATLLIFGSVPQVGAIVKIEIDDELPYDKAAMEIIKRREAGTGNNHWRVHSIYHEYKVLKSTDPAFSGASMEEQVEVILW